MRIERATREDVTFVARNMRSRDFAEFSAVSPFDDRKSMAEALADRYGGREDVLCAAKDEPICIGMTLETRPRVISLGFMATDRFPEIALGITRFVRGLLDGYEAAGTHRIEAVSLEGYEEAHRWLEVLGLRREAGPFPNFGKNGEAFVQFARVRDAGSARA